MNNLVQSNQVSVFNFKSTPVRTSIQEGEVWFCLIDVCDSLNLKRTGTIVGRLDEKGCRKTSYLSNGGKQETTFINEPNLYRLVFRSNKPAALQFAKWVYEDVLPTIRKTGGYGVAAIDMRAIGGMVKRCVHKALTEFLESAPSENAEPSVGCEPWEVTDTQILNYLYNWHLTRNKIDTVKMRELIQENESLKRRLAAIKQAII